MKRIKLLPAGMLLFLIAFSLSAPAAGLDGLPVTSIILKDDLGNPLPEHDSLLPLIEVKQGDPFSRQAG